MLGSLRSLVKEVMHPHTSRWKSIKLKLVAGNSLPPDPSFLEPPPETVLHLLSQPPTLPQPAYPKTAWEANKAPLLSLNICLFLI